MVRLRCCCLWRCCRQEALVFVGFPAVAQAPERPEPKLLEFIQDRCPPKTGHPPPMTNSDIKKENHRQGSPIASTSNENNVEACIITNSICIICPVPMSKAPILHPYSSTYRTLRRNPVKEPYSKYNVPCVRTHRNLPTCHYERQRLRSTGLRLQSLRDEAPSSPEKRPPYRVVRPEPCF